MSEGLFLQCFDAVGWAAAGRKGIRPVKKLSGGVLVWLFVCSEVQTGFTFLVPAHPGSPGQRVLNGCLCTKSLV